MRIAAGLTYQRVQQIVGKFAEKGIGMPRIQPGGEIHALHEGTEL
jgi:hypothetical protein